MDPSWLYLAIVLAAISAFIAALVADERDRPVGQAVVLGALLGILGVILVALLPRGARPPAAASPRGGRRRYRRLR